MTTYRRTPSAPPRRCEVADCPWLVKAPHTHCPEHRGARPRIIAATARITKPRKPRKVQNIKQQREIAACQRKVNE